MNTRQSDLQELRQSLRTARTPAERQLINHVASRIANETRKVKHMREALVNARLNGNTTEVKDINDFVRTHKDFQNER